MIIIEKVLLFMLGLQIVIGATILVSLIVLCVYKRNRSK